MTGVSVTAEGFTVDAEILATAFRLDQDTVQQKMRAGAITSLCEAGIDDDAGHFRVTFRYRGRALRLILDTSGAVLSQSGCDQR